MVKPKGKRNSKTPVKPAAKPEKVVARKSAKAEPAEANAIEELNDALDKAWFDGIQPICDAFIEWEEKYPKKLTQATAITLAEKILKLVKTGTKTVIDILE
jgi:hypothetical protein